MTLLLGCLVAWLVGWLVWRCLKKKKIQATLLWDFGSTTLDNQTLVLPFFSRSPFLSIPFQVFFIGMPLERPDYQEKQKPPA